MDNVTILASEPIMKVNPLGTPLVIIGVGIIIFSLFLLVIMNKPTLPLTVAVIGACLSFGGLGWAGINQVEDYIQYSVLISDDANFKEIYEKYEILEVKGEIYEVKEIESID